MFNAPIKNGLNCRRKCTGINPYEMTLDYAVATKEYNNKKTSPDLRHLWQGGRSETTGGGLIVGGFVVQLRKSCLSVLLRCK